MDLGQWPQPDHLAFLASEPTYVAVDGCWNRDPSDDAIQLAWHTGEHKPVAAVGVTPNTKQGRTLGVLADLYQGAYQRAVHHPARRGWHPRRVSSVAHPMALTGLVTRMPVDQVTGVLPNIELADFVGWFPPDADSEQFGTLFLYPVRGHKHTRWHLGQVGRARIGAVETAARWDRTADINALTATVEDNAGDYFLTLAALQNPKQLAVDKSRQDARQALLRLRAATPKSAIFTRETARALLETWDNYAVHLETLTSLGLLGWDAEIEPLLVAASYSLTSTPPNVVTGLRKVARRYRLTVVNRGDTAWMVRDPTYFDAHEAILTIAATTWDEGYRF